MENFLKLNKSKQNNIIDAALKSFSTNGYKKASISDIAAAAGISKAMIFHYFGTKKALYLYLVDLCSNIIINEINEKFDSSVTDFFDRIKMTTDIEISVVKKHPAILSFLTSMYFETDEEVNGDIKGILAGSENFRYKIAFEGVDTTKFKDNIDLKLVMKMLTWIADGFANQMSRNTELDLDTLFKEFGESLNLLKNNFYKEEYFL